MKESSVGRNITIAGIVFFIALSLVVSLVSYFIFSRTLRNRYQKQMLSIADYVESQLDHDDMAVCAATYEESEKYKVFQTFLDHFVDHYSDLHYVYIMKTQAAGKSPRAVEICAGNSTWEKENAPEKVLHLGDSEDEWQSSEVLDQFYDIQMGKEDVFLKNSSNWGNEYTLARPLVSSSGEHYACLCVDFNMDEINAVLYRNLISNIGLILIVGLIFVMLVVHQLRKNVTRPLEALEKSVTEYADKAAGRTNPDELRYESPNLPVRNEVWSLAQAVTKLSFALSDYVKHMIEVEREAKHLKEQVALDPLTLVKSKSAYNTKEWELQEDIHKGRAKFSILMADLNNLKKVNDVYGHEHGDEYIIGGCKMICDVFAHSPVYRVGGDEFAVVLEGKDYENREALLKQLREETYESMQNEDAEPWHRYSIAAAMSDYQVGDNVDTVLHRADDAMYEEKIRMKGSAR